MIPIFQTDRLSANELRELLKRPKISFSEIFPLVNNVISNVEKYGDEAVKDFNIKFDGFSSTPLVELVSDLEEPKLDPKIKEAIDVAISNVRAFHESQKESIKIIETTPGISCYRKSVPIESVGLYVPGGTAILPSTAIMLSVPAQLAGCSTVVLATPIKQGTKLSDEIAYISMKCGVTHILKSGGSQAIAAMSVGTNSVPKVDKLFGPGNQFVTAAKMILQNSEHQVSIDMPAGPSEVLVIADETSNPKWVAADLLSQAEHGSDSQVILVATSKFNLQEFNESLTSLLNKLPRKKFAEAALKNSRIFIVDTLSRAIELSNSYAPEHLIIQTDSANELAEKVKHAGSVFVGHFTPESLGDYASGTNHTLPTYGYARQYSGVSLDSYIKKITFQSATKQGLDLIGKHVVLLAELEELKGHSLAVSLRTENL